MTEQLTKGAWEEMSAPPHRMPVNANARPRRKHHATWLTVIVFIAVLAAFLTLHSRSTGTSPDALQRLTTAAEEGDAHAQAHIGTLYVLGDGVAQNDIYGYFWLVVAAKNGNHDFDEIRLDLASLLPPEVAVSVEKQARLWKPHTPAMIVLACTPEPVSPASLLTISQYPLLTQIMMRLKAWYFNATLKY